MKQDKHLKTKIESYMNKHYSVDSEQNILYTIDGEKLNPSILCNDITNIFGLTPNFALLITVEWLMDNEYENIESNWNKSYSDFNTYISPGVYTSEIDVSQYTLTASTVYYGNDLVLTPASNYCTYNITSEGLQIVDGNYSQVQGQRAPDYATITGPACHSEGVNSVAYGLPNNVAQYLDNCTDFKETYGLPANIQYTYL